MVRGVSGGVECAPELAPLSNGSLIDFFEALRKEEVSADEEEAARMRLLLLIVVVIGMTGIPAEPADCQGQCEATPCYGTCVVHECVCLGYYPSENIPGRCTRLQ